MFTCLMTMISNNIYYLQHIYFQSSFYKYNRFLHFHIIPANYLLIISFFSFLNQFFSFRVLLRIRKTFMQSLPLNTSCLFRTPLNDNIVDTEKPDGIYSPTFVADNFSGLFLHPSIFSLKDSRSA